MIEPTESESQRGNGFVHRGHEVLSAEEVEEDPQMGAGRAPTPLACRGWMKLLPPERPGAGVGRAGLNNVTGIGTRSLRKPSRARG